MPQYRVLEQLRRNAVALISLFIAISSLAYNTYRNELTEENRTVRQAGFEIISELSELQQVMLFARFKADDVRGDLTVGWAHIIALRDFSYVMPKNIQENTMNLHKIWQENHRQIAAEDDTSYLLIDKQIDSLKSEILVAITKLD